MDTHLFLASWPKQEGDRERHLLKAIETGEHLFGALERQGRRIEWWLDHSTRPFMRAIAALAELHLNEGNLDGAVEGFQRLIR